jgi:hypothetical protein
MTYKDKRQLELHREKQEKRLKRVKKMSLSDQFVSLMNNTKWQELFTSLNNKANAVTLVSIKLVDEDQVQLAPQTFTFSKNGERVLISEFPRGIFEESYLEGWGKYGILHYVEIEWVEFECGIDLETELKGYEYERAGDKYKIFGYRRLS